MPTYDYRCEANAQIVEVKHAMNRDVTTWGELCELAGIDRGATPANSPVKRLPTGGNIVSKSALKNNAPPCASGPCCGAGNCDFS
ncbi:MAG TPA: zinc ribbon domain-containing protein [Gammaproteobacteria bacterium]